MIDFNLLIEELLEEEILEETGLETVLLVGLVAVLIGMVGIPAIKVINMQMFHRKIDRVRKKMMKHPEVAKRFEIFKDSVKDDPDFAQTIDDNDGIMSVNIWKQLSTGKKMSAIQKKAWKKLGDVWTKVAADEPEWQKILMKWKELAKQKGAIVTG